MKVSYSEVNSACEQIERISEKMQEILENSNSLVKKLENGGIWTGCAAHNYVEKFNTSLSNFNDIFANIETSLQFFRNKLEQLKSIDQVIKNGYQPDFGLLNPKGFR